MDELPALLDRLLTHVTLLGLPVAALLRPGLSAAQIAEQVKELPFRLPREVYTLYQWHDGVPPNRYATALFPSGISGWVFTSLEDAIAEYREWIDIAHDTGGDDWMEIWRPQWFPLFHSDVPTYLCVLGQDADADTAPILDVDVENSSHDEEYTSLTHLMQVVVECYDVGAFYVTAEGYFEQDNVKVGAVRRRHAAQRADAALDTLRRGESGPALRQALNDVITFHDTRAFQPLLDLLRQADYADASLVLPLGQVGDERVVEPLLRVVRQGSAMDRARTGRSAQWAQALHHMDREASRRSHARGTAISALAGLAQRLQLRLPVEPFLAALDDPLPYIRVAAARMLGQLGGTQALEGLRTAIHDPDQMTRCVVAEALGHLGDARAVAPLMDMLADEDPGVQRYVREALERLRGTGQPESDAR